MSKTDKLFTIAGTSVVDGVRTFRVATGKVVTRVGVLRRAGHTEIDLTLLPSAMTKTAAIGFLQSQGVDAVVPTKTKKVKAAPPTPEQVAAAKLAAKRARDAAAKREKRAAAKVALQVESKEFGVEQERELSGVEC